MTSNIKYVHTNLIARDWVKLSQFYMDVFGCEPDYPERNLSGEWIDRMTGIKDVRIHGVHLKMPGYQNGPTLEIFEYDIKSDGEQKPGINYFGFGHIAFHVADVNEMVEKILSNGGSKYGELIGKEIPGVGYLKAVYTRDPEGNIIEIQHWEKE